MVVGYRLSLVIGARNFTLRKFIYHSFPLMRTDNVVGGINYKRLRPVGINQIDGGHAVEIFLIHQSFYIVSELYAHKTFPRDFGYPERFAHRHHFRHVVNAAKTDKALGTHDGSGQAEPLS